METNEHTNHIIDAMSRNRDRILWTPEDFPEITEAKEILHGLYEQGRLCAFGPFREIGRDGYGLRTEW